MGNNRDGAQGEADSRAILGLQTPILEASCLIYLASCRNVEASCLIYAVQCLRYEALCLKIA